MMRGPVFRKPRPRSQPGHRLPFHQDRTRNLPCPSALGETGQGMMVFEGGGRRNSPSAEADAGETKRVAITNAPRTGGIPDAEPTWRKVDVVEQGNHHRSFGQDPELRYVGNGQAVGRFSVATDESYTDREGKRQERTEWHQVVLFGKVAE